MAGNGKSRRGFASMDPARQREIASKGGKAAHAKGTAHEWSSDEARVAGRKGGEVVSRDRAHMAAIGREGGEARGQNARRARSQDGAGSRMSDRELTREISREGNGSDRMTDRSSGGMADRADERRADADVGLGSYGSPHGTDEVRPQF
jgi:general stress protein YciG